MSGRKKSKKYTKKELLAISQVLKENSKKIAPFPKISESTLKKMNKDDLYRLTKYQQMHLDNQREMISASEIEGKKRANLKLTNQDKNTIKELYEKGYSKDYIEKRFKLENEHLKTSKVDREYDKLTNDSKESNIRDKNFEKLKWIYNSEASANRYMKYHEAGKLYRVVLQKYMADNPEETFNPEFINEFDTHFNTSPKFYETFLKFLNKVGM